MGVPDHHEVDLHPSNDAPSDEGRQLTNEDVVLVLAYTVVNLQT